MTTRWTTLLADAVWAPSPHNVQPWLLSADDDRHATVYTDLRRALPKEDVTGSFLISAMGMFLEALAIAGHAQNLAVKYVLADDLGRLRDAMRDGSGDLPFAHVSAAPATESRENFSIATLRSRATARMAYAPVPLAAATLQSLRETAEKQGLQFGYTADDRAIRAIVDENVRALFGDLNDPPYHGEISLWFRCGEREEHLHRDGLSSRCMSMSAPELAMAKNFPNLLRVPLIRQAAAAHYRRALRCPAIGWLSGPFWEPEGALQAGHALMRFWLAITELGLSLHPLGNLVTNHAAAARIEDLTGVKDIWFIFKLGAAQNVPRSLRRPVEAFLR